MQKRWNILRADQSVIDSLHDALKINKTICKLLAQRGISSFDEAKNYFRPQVEHLHSPWLMKDMNKAVETIVHLACIWEERSGK